MNQSSNISPSAIQAEAINKAHRPHTKGYDYRCEGVYLITIVTKHRNSRLLGELNMDSRNPSVLLTKLGQEVEQQWLQTEPIQRLRGREIGAIAHIEMPAHFHAVLQVEKEMDVSVGQNYMFFVKYTRDSGNNVVLVIVVGLRF